MGSDTPATTDTKSSTSPWTEATPLLKNMISKYGGMNTDVTGLQSNALSNLNASAAGIPNLGATATGGVNKLFNNDVSPQVGMLGQGYDTLKANLGGTASGADLNPWNTPGFSDAMDTLSKNITTGVKGVYAGSGRDPSGAGSFGKSAALGIEQGEAPIIQSQFNQNKANQMSAANSLFSGAGTTAGGQAQLNQLPLNSIMSGLQGAGMLSGLYTAPAASQLAAANASQGQGYQNLQQLLTPALGLGALGTNTTGVSTQTPANSTLSNILGGGTAAAGMLGSLAPFLPFSDRRLKTDIKHVGNLKDGQKVYKFRYKAGGPPQLGMMAQEVAQHVPEAVHKQGDYLAVDYDKATQPARAKLGMLDMKEAA